VLSGACAQVTALPRLCFQPSAFRVARVGPPGPARSALCLLWNHGERKLAQAYRPVPWNRAVRSAASAIPLDRTKAVAITSVVNIRETEADFPRQVDWFRRSPFKWGSAKL
jgi:hypothetical protein